MNQTTFATPETSTGNLAADYQSDSFTDGYTRANVCCQYLATNAGLRKTWQAVLEGKKFHIFV